MRKTVRLLLSFHYWGKFNIGEHIRDAGGDIKVFADSGAYSADTMGARIDRQAYLEWLEANREHIVVAANLDVIGDAKASRENLDWLLARGAAVMPVYHAGEPWEVFDAYCRDFQYVALGGLVGWKPSRLVPFFKACFDRSRAQGSTARFHGFGMTSVEGLQRFPWYSVDSSSYCSMQKYGKLPVFNPIIGKTQTLRMRDTKSIQRLRGVLQWYGVDPQWFMVEHRATEQRDMGRKIGVRSYEGMRRHMQRLHGEVSSPNGDENGLLLYYACTNPAASAIVVGALRGWMGY